MRSPEIKPRVLVFCRPYLVPDFRQNVQPLEAEFDFTFLTDGRAPGTADTRADFYAALREGQRSDQLTAADETEVLARCRLLRNLDRTQALAMAHAMAVALWRRFQAVHPQRVLAHMVDDYVTHLVALLAQKCGAVYVGYAYSYFPGLVQVTQHAYGQALRVREPSDEEVDAVRATITQRVYRQNYLQRDNYTLARHIKGMLRYRVKQLGFAVKARLESDPQHLHYRVTPYIVERRRLSDFPREADFHADWQAALAGQRRARGKPVIYLPLGYFPESTIDYWIAHHGILRYEELMLQTVANLASDFVVVVKEHLHMMGARRRAFYHALRDHPGVVSVHPMEFSNDVLAASDAVVLGAGSVGVEATLRDKPVFSYCDSSYWFAASGATALDLNDIPGWNARILSNLGRHSPLSDRAKHEFVRECLRSTVRPRGRGVRWPHVQTGDLRDMLSISAGPQEPQPSPAPSTELSPA